jgi:hypothetical protein
MQRLIAALAPLLAAAGLVLPAGAEAKQKVVQLKTLEDPTTQPDAAVCAAAPFKANLKLGARVYAYELSHGRVIMKSARPVGTATACAQITSFAFPAGIQQKFYLQLNLKDGAYVAIGTCTIISNNVPQGGVIAAGCNLALVSAPAGVLGGSAVSNSVFNPFKLAGFNTGSYWTLNLYVADQVKHHDDDGDDDDDDGDDQADTASLSATVYDAGELE